MKIFLLTLILSWLCSVGLGKEKHNQVNGQIEIIKQDGFENVTAKNVGKTLKADRKPDAQDIPKDSEAQFDDYPGIELKENQTLDLDPAPAPE